MIELRTRIRVRGEGGLCRGPMRTDRRVSHTTYLERYLNSAEVREYPHRMRLRDPAIMTHFRRQDAQEIFGETFAGSFARPAHLCRNEQPEANQARSLRRQRYTGYLKNAGLNGLRSSPAVEMHLTRT